MNRGDKSDNKGDKKKMDIILEKDNLKKLLNNLTSELPLKTGKNKRIKLDKKNKDDVEWFNED